MQNVSDKDFPEQQPEDAQAGLPTSPQPLSNELRTWLDTLLPTERHCKVLVLYEPTSQDNRHHLACGHAVGTAIAAAYAATPHIHIHIEAAHNPLQAPDHYVDLIVYIGAVDRVCLEERLSQLRTTACRSSIIAVIIPNLASFWYWIGRIHHSVSEGQDTAPSKISALSLRELLAASGFHLLSETYIGRSYTNVVIDCLPNIDPLTREVFCQFNESPIPAAEQACAFVATAAHLNSELPPVTIQAHPYFERDELRAFAAAALANRIASDRRLQELTTELDQLRQQNSSLHLALESAERQAARFRSRVLEVKKQASDFDKNLSTLHALIVGTSRGLQSYQQRFDSDLAVYRSQRAWKAMLAIRNAYTLAVKHGLPGKFRALGALASALLGHTQADEHELHFPKIDQYLPPAIFEDRNVSPHHELPIPRSYDVIILAIIDFAFRFQRPQQLAVEYARRGHRVFWISANRFLPLTSSTPFTLRKLRDNLWEADLRAEPVDIYQHELSPALQHSLQSSFHEFARECSILDNIILVQLPFWRRSALDLKELTGGVLAYDCMDEWHSFNNLGRFNRMEEQSLVHDADVLFVTARRLADKFESVGLKPVLVRNGVDYEFFTRSTPSAAQWRSDGPIIGYFGAIADWIDLDLIYNVAKLRPSYTFVLIGQVFDRDTSALQTLPNIYLLGHQPYDSIPGFLHLFDVCHIPFLLNAITAATDPVKLYEYLALGKPVVATDMAELRDYSDLVYIGRGAEDYAAKLDLALLENTPASRHRRATFAKANTWSHRVDTMAATISAALPTVTIVIVTYNSAGFIEPCLASIWRNDSYPAIEVIVVDNASQDDTDDVLQNHSRNQPRLRYERLTTNRGFAAANNIGAAMGTGEYLLFLNADTITTPGWIGRLLQHLRAEPTIGLICPVTNFAGNEAKISITYRDLQEMEQFAVELASQKRGTWTELPMVPLYCAMMRRSIYEQIGGIDEQYEIGMFEDDDLSAAVRSLTLATAVAEDCFVHHFGQGSFSKLAPEEYNRIFTANRLRFERKWSTKWTGHKLRTGVRPPFEEIRFDPKEFCELSGATHTPTD